MTTTSRVLSVAVGVLVLWRVVVPSGALVLTTDVVAEEPLAGSATLVLGLAGLALVIAAGATVSWFGRALVGYLVVMAAYLVLGLALGRSVPWTAYAVLVAVAVLGGAAVAAGRRPA